MMKRCLTASSILLLISFLAVGCGVPQEEYDAVLTERDEEKTQMTTQQAQLQTLRGELATAKADLTVVQGDLGAKENNLATVKNNLLIVKQKLTNLQGDYQGVCAELDEIKRIYPPRDFATLKELQDWLAENDISERQEALNAAQLYGRALEIRDDALEDSFLVSTNIYYNEVKELWYIGCTATIDGYIWIWGPTHDEPVQLGRIGKVK